VSLLLVNAHSILIAELYANFEHVGIVPAAWSGSTCGRKCLEEVFGHGIPHVTDIRSCSPRVSNLGCPFGCVLFAPLADRIEDRPARLVQGISHLGVSFDRWPALIVTIIILEVVDVPGCVVLGINVFIVKSAGSTLACLRSR